MTSREGHDLKRVHLTLDGETVLARHSQTILQVARENGFDIPTLCYLERLKPIGSCRMCVVQIEGLPTPVAACTTQVLEGMVVTTTSPALEELRRETLKLMLLGYPMDCDACEIQGECDLENLIHRYDIGPQDLHPYQIQPVEGESEPYATPVIEYHRSRCILCGRCIQACMEISGEGVIDYKGTGAETRVAPVEPTPEFHPECVSCGECVAVCPTNALTEATRTEPRGKSWERTRVQTTCGYCGCGCQMELNVLDNRVVGVGSVEGGVNNGALCAKGRFGYHFVHHPDRLKHPLIRREDGWEEVSWDEALDYVADRLIQIRAQYGPDAIGALGSARCTNEDNYLFQKFARGVIGTNNVDHCARL